MRGPASTDCRSVTEGKRRPSSTSYNWAGQKAMRSLRSSSLRSRDALHLSSCERSELPSLFNARIFYIFIYIFQAVRRAVNEMFETPDTVFNNLELLMNPSSTAKKCSATEDCCRNPGGDRHPSSTVKYCSATGLLPNRQRGERPGVTDCRSVTEGKRRPSSTSYNWAGQKAMRSLRSSSLRSRDALHLSSVQ